MGGAVTFIAGATGTWIINKILPVVGESLPTERFLQIADCHTEPMKDRAWSLLGISSNVRYAQRWEVDQLAEVQEGLGRPKATYAALIPIRKSEAWWNLAQDERRAIMEEQSRHIGIGMEYLPEISRKLFHSRDLGEPFDFLTWFEYAPEHEALFETLVNRLRATAEWSYVDREVDIRLIRAASIC
jgi:chlorite dismutase